MAKLQGAKKSIGEVLAQLKQEFDDISISKIRFLESQGLIDPERTPSGYRKFSEEDIARLRYILRQQKEHFLPLKVIRGRLDEVSGERSEQSDVSPAMNGADVRDGMVATSLIAGATLDRRQLMSTSGLTDTQLRELEGFGLIKSHSSSEGTWYDEQAIVIAKLASRLLHYGTEVRHLRIYKTASDREADLYRQLTVPVRDTRNTQAKMDSQARLNELMSLGEAMRSELLRQDLDV
jgi:DNA-binding transcriptional MerR regulator